MIAAADALLRGRGEFAVDAARVPLRALGLLALVFGFAYGAGMGAYSGRAAQAVYSGLKVPLLLGLSTLVCLPSFFVVNTILGLRDDFAAALRAVLCSQATVAVALGALLPITGLAYVSSANYRFAVLFNGVQFALAALAGQRTLGRHYRPLVARHQAHAHARRLWLALYIFVAIQLAWVLRPFVGAPGLRSTFLREDAWSNAYVVVLRDVLGFGG
ncbi:MAG: hypothetical protein AAFZ65_16885 [Planctomycetota bacterium]